MTNFFQYYCMNRVTHIKSLNDFCNILLKHKKESIFEFKEDLMTLVQSSLIEDLINLELEVIKNKGLYAPVPASFAHITIFDSPLYSLYIYSKSVNDLKTLTHCSTHASDRIVIPLNENGFIGDFFTQSVSSRPFLPD